VFKSTYYADVSLDQWMALTPPELVEDHLKLDRQVMDALRSGIGDLREVPYSQGTSARNRQPARAELDGRMSANNNMNPSSQPNNPSPQYGNSGAPSQGGQQ
jgi:hypothetical protein